MTLASRIGRRNVFPCNEYPSLQRRDRNDRRNGLCKREIREFEYGFQARKGISYVVVARDDHAYLDVESSTTRLRPRCKYRILNSTFDIRDRHAVLSEHGLQRGVLSNGRHSKFSDLK
ncbi:hypothetical protein L596_001359 [Steinernema carpocapsae]|uniref:Uncharacterized protein n=1 Tax=Steinernema carpocapsae TaxID=34508 RepID=A0A4U8UKT6_STECR|nr:hypothetical protein L596_001359 [Steinernema carpocapsae]